MSSWNLRRELVNALTLHFSSRLSWFDFAVPVSWRRPEVFRAGLSKTPTEYNEQADVFSFAIFMYTLAAKTPFPYESLYLVPQQVVEAVSLRGLRPPLSPSFRLEPAYVSLMEECWSANPEDRPRMDAVALALHSLLEETSRTREVDGANPGNRRTGWGAWLGFYVKL